MRATIALIAVLAAGCAAQQAPPPTAAEVAEETTIVLTETSGWANGSTLNVVMAGDEIISTSGDTWSSEATGTLGTNEATLDGTISTEIGGVRLGTLVISRAEGGGLEAEMTITDCQTECTGDFSS